ARFAKSQSSPHPPESPQTAPAPPHPPRTLAAPQAETAPIHSALHANCYQYPSSPHAEPSALRRSPHLASLVQLPINGRASAATRRAVEEYRARNESCGIECERILKDW